MDSTDIGGLQDTELQYYVGILDGCKDHAKAGLQTQDKEAQVFWFVLVSSCFTIFHFAHFTLWLSLKWVHT